MKTEYEKTMNEAQNRGWAKGCLSVAIIKLEALEPYIKGWENESIKQTLEYLRDAQEKLSK